MRILVVVIALALPAAAHAQSSRPKDPLARGRVLVAEYCGACHATGRSGASPRAEAPPFRTLGDKIELDDFPDRLQQGLSSSHPDMPTFKFKPRDANAVRAYLLTIQK